MGLFGKRRVPAEERKPPSVPEGTRVYAVGDIHGRADLLKALHGMIAEDAQDFPGAKKIVYLGDAIDRGDDSRGVLNILLDDPLPGFEAVHLMGNHEYAADSFLEDSDAAPGWLTWGGREFLYSYGIQCGLNPGGHELEMIARELNMCMPAAHREFLAGGDMCHREGDYYFVHAGIRPGVPLEEQRFEDQLFIREPFLSDDRDHGGVVVHGHTIADEVTLRHNRIGVDTGAYYTGVLSCLVLEGESQRILQTRGE